MTPSRSKMAARIVLVTDIAPAGPLPKRHFFRRPSCHHRSPAIRLKWTACSNGRGFNWNPGDDTQVRQAGRDASLRARTRLGVCPANRGKPTSASSGSVLVRSAGSEYLVRHSLERGVERLRRGQVVSELTLARWSSVVLHRIASGPECLETASIDAQAGLVCLSVDHETLDGPSMKASLGSLELVPMGQRNRLAANHHRLFQVVQG